MQCSLSAGHHHNQLLTEQSTRTVRQDSNSDDLTLPYLTFEVDATRGSIQHSGH